MAKDNQRNKDRWHLEPEEGLRDSVEQALNEQKQKEPKLSRNEYLSRLIRRAISDEAKAPVVQLKCAEPLTMAEFRGDIDKMEKHFVRVRSAILHRSRCVDKDDPESVERFKDDDRQTREFLDECKKLLVVAKDRAWDLRGFKANEAEYVRKTCLDGWRKWVAEWRAEVANIEAEGKSKPLSVERSTRLDESRKSLLMYSAMISLAEFALMGDGKNVG